MSSYLAVVQGARPRRSRSPQRDTTNGARSTSQSRDNSPNGGRRSRSSSPPRPASTLSGAASDFYP
eukprot:3159326-Rhodomonas_salina.1